MHAVVKDALTLTAIAVTYIFVAIQFRPIFGVFLTRNVILGTPLFGVLVRYRLHYIPVTKSVYQDTERLDGRLRIGDDKDDSFTYPTMFRNVYSIEGPAAYYKGVVPVFISFIFFEFFGSLPSTILGLFVEDTTTILPSGYTGLILRNVAVMLWYLPVYVLCVRAITVPNQLSFFTPIRRVMNTLFTPAEIRHPFTFMNLIRGAALCLLLHQLYIAIIFRDLDKLISSWVDDMGLPTDISQIIPEGSLDFTPSREALMAIGLTTGTNILIQIGTAIVLCPLEIIATRLSAQRVYEAPRETDRPVYSDTNILIDMDDNDETPKERLSSQPQDEPHSHTTHPLAFKSRCSTVPYDGFLSCLQVIIREEGRGTLWRGWWLTMIKLWFMRP